MQPVLDAIIDYLPDPSQRLPPPLVADSLQRIQHSVRGRQQHPPALLTFKILFDPQRGPLTLARIFSGHVSTGMQIRNWTRPDLDDNVAVEKVHTK